MKFIYCLNPTVAKDFELIGLKRLGYTYINGERVAVFENNKTTYLNIYQKGEIFLTNRLSFAITEE